jgi:hypothetical protein
MKKIIGILLIVWGAATGVAAQTMDTDLQLRLEETRIKLEEFNTEHKIDSLDQEKLPKIVSGGVLAGVNISNFIIVRNHSRMHSHMRVGGEFGGFLDFRITPHFAIQPQVLFSAHQNYFAATDTTNHLWSFGAEIPIYFLGRYGNMEKGYIQFGGGLFTHFTFASNVADKFNNIEETPAAAAIPRRTASDDNYDYSSLYTLHNNHFGVCMTVGYECSFGLQINATYKVSFSDIATFYKENEGQPIADALIYPQSISLILGYRWR